MSICFESEHLQHINPLEPFWENGELKNKVIKIVIKTNLYQNKLSF